MLFLSRSLVQLLVAAPWAVQQGLVHGWSLWNGGELYRRLVEPLQSFLTDELRQHRRLTVPVMNCIKVLHLVHQANALGGQLPLDAFNNHLIRSEQRENG